MPLLRDLLREEAEKKVKNAIQNTFQPRRERLSCCTDSLIGIGNVAFFHTDDGISVKR